METYTLDNFVERCTKQDPLLQGELTRLQREHQEEIRLRDMQGVVYILGFLEYEESLRMEIRRIKHPDFTITPPEGSFVLNASLSAILRQIEHEAVLHIQEQEALRPY